MSELFKVLEAMFDSTLDGSSNSSYISIYCILLDKFTVRIVLFTLIGFFVSKYSRSGIHSLFCLCLLVFLDLNK